MGDLVTEPMVEAGNLEFRKKPAEGDTPSSIMRRVLEAAIAASPPAPATGDIGADIPINDQLARNNDALRAKIAELEESLRVALRYIDTETCGAPDGTIRQLHRILERGPPAALASRAPDDRTFEDHLNNPETAMLSGPASRAPVSGD